MIKAIFVDMDGTLLGKSQVAVSRRNMAALDAALEKGVHVIPCTGRVFDMMPPQLLTHRGIRYFITGHGARAYDREQDTSLYEDLIPAPQAAAVLELLEGKGLYNEIAAACTIYLEKAVATDPLLSAVPEHHIWYFRDNCFTAVEKPSEYFRSHELGVEKMNIYGIPEHLQQSVFDDVTATGFIRHTRGAASANLEFSSRTLNKMNATDAVLNALGIDYSECLAIGDSSTDLEVIKTCGIGVAMGNAPEDIKAAADHITGLNTEDGFAQAIEKFVL